MDSKRLLDRFLRYVRVDTTADETSTHYPSSPGQIELGRLLVDELRAMGVSDAAQDEHGIVLATITPSPADGAEADRPVIAWCAHLDTSPETSGTDVKPQVVDGYDGRDIVLPGDSSQVIRVDANPQLEKMAGNTLITSDGTTLLGADDKSGVAVIMEAAQRLTERPEIPHGPIRLCFTCDEEIGRGTSRIDLDRVGAVACYTLDGEGVGSIDVETFSADLIVVDVRGRNIHPSIAKGVMINAARALSTLIAALPAGEASPESTAGREGFVHPYEIEGGVGRASARILLRGFDQGTLDRMAGLVTEAACQARLAFPDAVIDVTRTVQYRNMRSGLEAAPRVVQLAEEAVRAVGLTPKRTIVRGGTDGSRLTEMGLPAPNLGSGQHTPHSLLEWACLEEMETACQVLLQLAQFWGKQAAS